MELKRAIEIITTMCKESNTCKSCPLFQVEARKLCTVEDLSSYEIPILEQKLIQWEKEHEVHYPTWRQWVRGQYPLGQNSIICPNRFINDVISADECLNTACDNCYDSEISAYAAKILGVEPIERKDD